MISSPLKHGWNTLSLLLWSRQKDMATKAPVMKLVIWVEANIRWINRAFSVNRSQEIDINFNVRTCETEHAARKVAPRLSHYTVALRLDKSIPPMDTIIQ